LAAKKLWWTGIECQKTQGQSREGENPVFNRKHGAREELDSRLRGNDVGGLGQVAGPDTIARGTKIKSVPFTARTQATRSPFHASGTVAMSYREITIADLPKTNSRAIAAADAAAQRYRMQLIAAFLPATAILVAAAILIAKVLAA
jgi:hypothetical protein